MDRVRRDAERSGDSLRHALELRRQGQDQEAKRLLQDLTWDDAEGAEQALEQLYPLHPDLLDALDIVENGRPNIGSIPQYLGCFDPRVSRRIEKVLLTMLERFSGDDIGQALFSNWLEHSRKRTLLERLNADNEHFGNRLTWAEPLKDELNALIEAARSFRDDPDRDPIGRVGDLTLGWHIKRAGSKAQLRRWTEGLNPLTWRERLAVAEGRGESDFYQGRGAVRPSWFPDSIAPNLSVESRAFSLNRNVFVDRGTPKHQFQWNHDFIVLHIELSPHIDFGVGRLLQVSRDHVSAWQAVVGDRVIRWTAQEFLIVWEYGAVDEVLHNLVKQSETVPWPDGISSRSVSMGATRLKNDWFEAIERGRALCLLARERKRPFMLEEKIS